MKNIIKLLIMVSIFCGESRAETFEFKRGMSVKLGATWNPLQPEDVGGSTICLTSVPSSEPPNANEQYSESFVNSFQELQRVTGMSFAATGNYSYGIAKASASASYDTVRESFRSDREIVYVVTGQRSYTPKTLDSVALNSTGLELLKEAKESGNSTNFYKACGQSIITGVSKESNVSLVYIFKTSDSSLREKVKSAISAAISSGGNKGEISVKIVDEARKIDSSISFDLKVFQSGVLDNTDSIRNTVGVEPGDIVALRSALQKVVAGISWERSATSSFTARKLSDYFDIPPIPNWSYVFTAYSRVDNLRDSSEKLVKRYIQLKDVISDAKAFHIKLKPGQQEVIISELAEIEKNLETLVSVARSCFESKVENCNTPYIDVSTAVMKFMDIDYGEFAGWRGEGAGSYAYDVERVNQTATYWPAFILRNLKYIRSLDVIADGKATSHMENNQIEKNITAGTFSARSILFATNSASSYCDNKHHNRVTVCMPWSEDKARALNELRNIKMPEYSLRITDVEGGQIQIKIPPLSATTFN